LCLASRPIFCGATFYGMATLGDPGSAGLPQTDQQKMMQRVMKVFAVGLVPLTSWMSSGVFVYWISNNAFAVSQSLLLKTPVVRSAVGLPPMPKGTTILPQLAPAATAKAQAPAAPFIPSENDFASARPSKVAAATGGGRVSRPKKGKGKKR